MQDNAGQQYLQGSGAGWPGVLCRDPTKLTAQLWMSSHLRFVIALG